MASYAAMARRVARWCGRPVTVAMAVAFVVGWTVSGPIFNYSDSWQLVANTVTNVVTFLMVFLIQSSQDHDTAAIQLKLDELIRATNGAHNALLDLEELDEKTLDSFRARYEQLARLARQGQVAGQADTGSPEA
ncbi:low affinity iron permease family protein [Pseudogemmobacter blasticus]|uniref:Low affinity iron permease family protein n=1 Tax=Fuscovulum blasticum DSM 2131 TaxID=1188250 RepID=A0A2T4J768_FUSBL|nr:low affinity iron permease family protein [Fuscovulum blasticum]PTE13739.1 hypothetical protein C5F44_13060 [Fuscovulum blasticum DSM 2131]